MDQKNAYDFKNKRVTFFSCLKNYNTCGDGLMSKKEFFNLIRRGFEKRGATIAIFNERQKKESKGFDLVIIIDCPDRLPTNKDLTWKLNKKYP